MKNTLILIICLLLSVSVNGQTTGSMTGSLNGLEKYGSNVNPYDAAIGYYNGYYYYTYVVFDLSSLGGVITSVNSGTIVTVTLNTSGGYNGTQWGIFFLSDITSYSYPQQASAIAGGSGAWNYDEPGIATLSVSKYNIHNNKIIVGIRTKESQGQRKYILSATLDYSFQIVPKYTITTNSNPASYGTTSGGGIYSSGAAITVQAMANNGYMFSNWSENGNIVSTNAAYSFTVNSDRNLTANFTAMQYTITTSSNPPNGGTTSGGGIYNAGSNITLTAAPTAGSTFINWTENGNVVSTSASYSFIVNSNRNLVANFTAPPVQLTVGYNRGTGKIVAYTGSNYATPYAPATLSDVQGVPATFAPVTPGNDGAPTENGYNLIYNDNQANKSVSFWKFTDHLGRPIKENNLSPAQNTITLSSDINGASYKAQMYRLCDVTITAASHEGQIPIQIQVDGTNKTTAYNTTKIEGNVINITAPANYTLTSGYWMNYTFAYWKVDGNYYSSNPVLTEIQINEHKSFEAYYTSTINNGYKTTQYSGNTGDYITLDWSEHPNSNVSYQI